MKEQLGIIVVGNKTPEHQKKANQDKQARKRKMKAFTKKFHSGWCHNCPGKFTRLTYDKTPDLFMQRWRAHNHQFHKKNKPENSIGLFKFFEQPKSKSKKK